MVLYDKVRSRVRAARTRGDRWTRWLDTMVQSLTAQGRSVLVTRLLYRNQVHQTTPFTCEDRYPELFALAARLSPAAERILSFGCSTGEELSSLRRVFPSAQITGAEINPRSRRQAAIRMNADGNAVVVSPDQLHGSFDVIFALAVLQREPHRMIAMQVKDLSPYYPFERFNAAVRTLSDVLRPGGLLCVANAQYRIEDSSVAQQLETVVSSPLVEGAVFGPDGLLLENPVAHTIFRRHSLVGQQQAAGQDQAAG